MTKFSHLLALEQLGPDQFLAARAGERAGRLFGGQLAAQALRAGCLTAPPGRRPHSLHAYFLRPGRADLPIRFSVARSRDGRSFSTRLVTAWQADEAIFMMMASFHAGEDGPDWHAFPRPAVPEPDEVPPAALSWFSAWADFDVRPVRSADQPDALHPCWVRLREPLPDDSGQHACALAFISDLGVVYSARKPGAARRPVSGASLDHALWLHRPVRADEWLLFSVWPASNSSARGLATGTLHTADGTLAASMTQEAILRPTGGLRAG